MSDENEALTVYTHRIERNLGSLFVLTLLATYDQMRAKAIAAAPVQFQRMSSLAQVLQGTGGLSFVRHVVKEGGRIRVSHDFHELSSESRDWIQKIYEYTLVNKLAEQGISKLGKLILDTNTETHSRLMEVVLHIFLVEKVQTHYSFETLLSHEQALLIASSSNVYLQQSCFNRSVRPEGAFECLVARSDRGMREVLKWSYQK